MLQTPRSAEGQARGVPSGWCSAACSPRQSGSSDGVSSEEGLPQHPPLCCVRNWLTTGGGVGEVNKSRFFCFKHAGQTYNSLPTSSRFHPAIPLSAEFWQETGTKHQLNKDQLCFFCQAKKKVVVVGDDVAGEGGAVGGGGIQAWSHFAFKTSCQGSPLSSHLPWRKSEGAAVRLPRTRGTSHQTTPSLTWHIRPSHALAFPRASVKACDRQREQQIPSEDVLSTIPASSADKNPHLWAIKLGKNKTQEQQGLNALAHLATSAAHFLHGRHVHSWHKHADAASSAI